MPGADSRYKPPSASESSASDEASQLDLLLQRQLEEDIARIFDESIYSDLDVVCGKLKVSTHSCILQARTTKFYRKLEKILHINIARSTFDEIYSFISDTYTECNISQQEKEIFNYLKSVTSYILKKGEEIEPEDFSTPNCTPHSEKSLKRSISSSPSTELTKEYYSLVPIESNLLDKELNEQDVLSDAFQSIIISQVDDLHKVNKIQLIKPTSLDLVSSHTSKIVTHSGSRDILGKNNIDDILSTNEKGVKIKSITSHNSKSKFQSYKPDVFNDKNNLETVLEPAYSPDSLITDEPSSASDYLSAAFNFSPGTNCNDFISLNSEDHITKMENNYACSDSGMENSRLVQSHKCETLTDISLSESTLHNDDEACHSHDSANISMEFPNSVVRTDDSNLNNTNSEKHKDFSNSNSSKQEKQRLNEEIVLLESSSLSSETGSWESVFPPKTVAKEASDKIINDKQINFSERDARINENTSNLTESSASLVQKSPFKSTSCFIDASSLADDENESIVITHIKSAEAPSQPLPCSTNRTDLSPNDWSENDNEDSLELLENKDYSMHKDSSPTIFEMTPVTEDSLCTNADPIHVNEIVTDEVDPQAVQDISTSTFIISQTPHNSIMSLKDSDLQKHNADKNITDPAKKNYDGLSGVKHSQKYNESSPIISGGVSIEDHLPTVGSFSGSPIIRRRMENAPIVSGAYTPPSESFKAPKSPKSCAPVWIIDMSSTPQAEETKTDKLKSLEKKIHNNSNQCGSSSEKGIDSISSIDSDSSERFNHNFFIDLSNLSDSPVPETKVKSENRIEKKNIFSMYIDFNKESAKELHKPPKEMPKHPREISKSPRELSKSPREMSKSPREMSKSPKDISNPLKDTPKVSKEVSKGIPKPSKEILAKSSPMSINISLSAACDSSESSTFIRYEALCSDPTLSISEIIRRQEKYREESRTKERKVELKKEERDQPKMISEESSNKRTMNSVPEVDINVQEDNLFVKLSDLDKPMPPLGIPERSSNRMTRSIPDNNWSGPNQAPSRSNEVISSFHSENALSLNRLFPHLRNEFSRSMPGSLSSRTRSPFRFGASTSPADIEEQASDTSEMSSMQSSCRSIVDNSTTEDMSHSTSLLANCQSRLGKDLLRMFLEEIAPDVIVEVSGRRIKAHKCILSSRCQYFAGILSGGWVESAGNVIDLPPFSYDVVYFALCHIYSGISNIPDSISIVELATLADMLGLEGLKEAIMFTLKAKYCHHFHMPCGVCTAGVLECFPLSSVYGLDDLYRKCLVWIAKYFSRVWPTKAFATLPSELLEKCYQQIVVDLPNVNIIDTAYGCGIAAESLPNLRWAEVVDRMLKRVVRATAQKMGQSLTTVLKEIATLPSDPPSCAMRGLNECLAAAFEQALPDEAIRSYRLLAAIRRLEIYHRSAKPDLINNDNVEDVQIPRNLLYNNVHTWFLLCERALVKGSTSVPCTQEYIDVPCEFRKRLRDRGCTTFAPSILQRQMAPSQNQANRGTTTSNPQSGSTTAKSSDLDQMRAAFVPYKSKPTTADVDQTHINLKKKLSAVTLQQQQTTQPKVRTTKAQEERAKFNLNKTTSSLERLNLKTVKSAFENTKPRYLDQPKPAMDNAKNMPNTKRLASKIISSSESSRNSSPVQYGRNLRASRIRSAYTAEDRPSQSELSTSSQLPEPEPEPEPSTDSLSESQNSNKYATYTKTKHITKGITDYKPANKPAEHEKSAENSKTARKDKPAKNKSTGASNARSNLKTKIPVYLNRMTEKKQNNQQTNAANNKNDDAMKKSSNTMKTSASTTTTSTTSLLGQPRQKNYEKGASCSLMNATKSSSAKIVTKVKKESAPRGKGLSKASKIKRPQRGEENVPPPVVSVMERSGTFLKDEPTFGDITTDIDTEE